MSTDSEALLFFGCSLVGGSERGNGIAEDVAPAATLRSSGNGARVRCWRGESTGVGLLGGDGSFGTMMDDGHVMQR